MWFAFDLRSTKHQALMVLVPPVIEAASWFNNSLLFFISLWINSISKTFLWADPSIFFSAIVLIQALISCQEWVYIFLIRLFLKNHYSFTHQLSMSMYNFSFVFTNDSSLQITFYLLVFNSHIRLQVTLNFIQLEVSVYFKHLRAFVSLTPSIWIFFYFEILNIFRNLYNMLSH